MNNDQPIKPAAGLKRIFKALFYSLDGLKAAYANEPAFRQETLLGLPLIVLAIFLPVTAMAKALMIGSILLVLIVELINSGIEAVVDRISLERHELSKRAKDVGSAAVLIALINVLVVWTLLLMSHYS